LILDGIQAGIADSQAGEESKLDLNGAQALFERWQERDPASVAAEPAVADADPAKWDDQRQVSYLFGFVPMTRTIKSGKLDSDAMIKGVADSVAGAKGLIGMDQAQAVFMAYDQELQAAQQQAAAANVEKGKTYLAETAAKEGVTATGTGLLYEVITAGDGPVPGPTDKVRVHYTGKLLDGTVFDSSEARGEPISFAVNGVIRGWTEALQLMKVGSRYRLHIPPELGYGAQGTGGDIPPNAVLVFEVELLGIE
ncbi:MAG: FKBP-type peptidyl-prolyl cis-trans isomerase, partial [Planctomycetota bacterium]|nr:FKBP-type peptidyl-prolyl cis-trans isomerase [Planctomycetota bacterium]